MTDAIDIACASLLAFLESSRPCPDEPFDLCESLPCHLGSLQLQRWRHLHGIAERQYYRAREERDRTADALERLPDDLGVGAIARAFQGAWLSLRAKCEVLGPRAWARLRAAVLWDGMDTALDEVQRPMSRTLDIGSILLARVMGATWR